MKLFTRLTELTWCDVRDTCVSSRHIFLAQKKRKKSLNIVTLPLYTAVMHRTFKNMATDRIAPSRALKITSNRRCQENRERVSAGDRQTKSSNKNLKTMFFSISKSEKRRKKGGGEREACTRRRSFFVIVPASGDVPRLVCEREGAA